MGRDRRRRRPQRPGDGGDPGPGRLEGPRPRGARPGRWRGRHGRDRQRVPGARRSPIRSAGCAGRWSATFGSRTTALRSWRRTSGSSRPRRTAARSRSGRTSPGRPTGCGRGPATTPGRTRTSTASSARWAGSWPISPGRRRRTSPRRASGTRSPDSSSGARSAASARKDGRTVLRVLPMAVADLVAESFENDAVRGAIAARGVLYSATGPWSAGSAFTLLADSAGNDGGAAGQTVFARGGPGALSDALAAAIRKAGGEIRTSAPRGADHRAGRTGDRRRPRLGRGDRGEGRRRRHRPEAVADEAHRPRHRSARRWPGGPATSGRPARSPRSTSPSRACPGSRRPATTASDCSAAGSCSRRASTPSSAPSTRASTGG